jgi:hypothetical protein
LIFQHRGGEFDKIQLTSEGLEALGRLFEQEIQVDQLMLLCAEVHQREEAKLMASNISLFKAVVRNFSKVSDETVGLRQFRCWRRGLS